MTKKPSTMTKAELEHAVQHVVALAGARLGQRVRRHWVGSEITDAILRSDRPTHRNWFIWHPQGAV
jgi:hypothetical protein